MQQQSANIQKIRFNSSVQSPFVKPAPLYPNANEDIFRERRENLSTPKAQTRTNTNEKANVSSYNHSSRLPIALPKTEIKTREFTKIEDILARSKGKNTDITTPSLAKIY